MRSTVFVIFAVFSYGAAMLAFSLYNDRWAQYTEDAVSSVSDSLHPHSNQVDGGVPWRETKAKTLPRANAEKSATPKTTKQITASPTLATTTAKQSPFDRWRSTTPNDPDAEQRRQAVKKAMKHSWDGYVQFAWGQDELRPVSRSGRFFLGMGTTIVDAMSTLIIMDLKGEFEQAAEWCEKTLSFHGGVQFFETVIRGLGGLLSAYQLTGRTGLRDKAIDLGSRLVAAFNTNTGLPNMFVDLGSRTGSGDGSNIAEVGSCQLEFNALAQVTGDTSYANKGLKVFRILAPQGNGLYPIMVNAQNGHLNGGITLGGMGDSFYEYLQKTYLQFGCDDLWTYFERSMDSVLEHLLQKTAHGRIYLSESNGARMEHLACFAGGMLAMGSLHVKDKKKAEKWLQAGAGITETCYHMYHDVGSGLAPEHVTFGETGDGRDFRVSNGVYILRPETVESLFYMWRVTHDQKYRDWGWEIFQSMEKHCKVEGGGYSGLTDVESDRPGKDDVMQSFWLAETLKYLYLLFSPDDLVPLDKYVFNTEAHPLLTFDTRNPCWEMNPIEQPL